MAEEKTRDTSDHVQHAPETTEVQFFAPNKKSPEMQEVEDAAGRAFKRQQQALADRREDLKRDAELKAQDK